jgi:hypothetical protein
MSDTLNLVCMMGSAIYQSKTSIKYPASISSNSPKIKPSTNKRWFNIEFTYSPGNKTIFPNFPVFLK